MGKTSAGLLLHHRNSDGEPMVLLVHPGGPYFARKDDGHWTIPKGEHGPEEDPHRTALREFHEELGSPPPPNPEPDIDLGEVTQAGGKRVRCWARRGDFDAGTCRSNTFELEWPPRSGRRQAFPEVDRAEWFTLTRARAKINDAQVTFLDRLGAQADHG